LTYYWITRATTEGAHWLDAFLASEDGTPAGQALAYFVRGFLGVLQSDPDGARPALERAVEQARANWTGFSTLAVARHGIPRREHGRRPPIGEALTRSG
jgi:hypothetical protein